ncbi:MAG: hypothetical protein PSV35_01970 [bacterium]|nr:hypothetical protein [bacterium]
MADIRIHVLNFHSIWSHVEIVLENKSTEPHTFYGINRWDYPKHKWFIGGPKYFIEQASSTYSFDIDADPDVLMNGWITYWRETQDEANIFGKNCAVAAQWFLTEFGGIPQPSLSNISLNHFAFGIFWPSFIPCPVMLPGRIMSNAAFHIEAKNNPETTTQYTYLFLYASLTLATLAFAASVFALTVAATVLTGGIAGLAIGVCVVGGLASSSGFFKAYNILSAKNNIGQAQLNQVSSHDMSSDNYLVHDEKSNYSMSC